MTAYSVTISNQLRTFGEGPPSLWNSYNWGSFKWGEGTATIPWTFIHLVDADDLQIATARYFQLVKLLGAETISLDSLTNFFLVRLVTNTLTLASDSSTQYLRDGEGYYYVFPGGVTNADDRAVPSWSAGSAGSQTWTQGSASSTSWSAA